MAGAKKPSVKSEIGESGVVVNNGVIFNEEYNRDLVGLRGYRIYDEMRRSDATVRATLNAMYLPILAAEMYIAPASDDESDKKIAEEVEDNLFNRLNWHSFLQEAMTMLPFGFAVFEQVHGVDQVDGKWMIVLDKLSFRKQTTIQYWEMETGHKPGITQLVPTGAKHEIPMDKLCILTNQKEGNNPEGISVLRSAYQHWYIKKTLYKIDAIGHERQALGVVKIHRPAKFDPKDMTAATTAARNLRANEEAFIVEPEGWVVEFMNMMAGSLRDMEPSINHHDRQISKNSLAQFIEIGAAGGTGTRSTSEDHSRLFELSLQAIAQNLCDSISEQVIKRLVDMNYNVDKYPKLAVGKIGDTNIPQVSEALKKFVEAKLLTPTDEDEVHIRKLTSLPDMPEDIKGQDRNPKPLVVQPKDADAADEVTDEDTPTDEVKAKKALKAARELKAAINGMAYGTPGHKTDAA